MKEAPSNVYMQLLRASVLILKNLPSTVVFFFFFCKKGIREILKNQRKIGHQAISQLIQSISSSTLPTCVSSNQNMLWSALLEKLSKEEFKNNDDFVITV